MLRTGWFVLNLLVFTFWYGSLAIVSGLLRVPNRPGGVYDHCARAWSRRLLRAAGADLDVVGTEHLPKDHPVVYVSNHQSWFDIFALASTLPGQMRFVAKKELASIPLLGRAMRSAEHIFIDRQNRQAAFSAYEEAAKAIRAGLNAVVFAEGTRSRTGELQSFKKGPFVLAIAAQVPIVPVYCAGTFTLLRKGSIRINPHPIALMFGKPINTEGLVYDDREELMKITRQAIEQLRADSHQVLA
jgi:1-acyl-sn-glycerol-3-phosphate acyltransferase